MRFKNRTKSISLIICLAFLFSLCSAGLAYSSDFPSFTSFDGTVTYQNGTPVESGTVKGYINGELRGTCPEKTDAEGNYIRLVVGGTLDDQGKTITFKVELDGVDYDAASQSPASFDSMAEGVIVDLVIATEPPVSKVVGTASDADVDMAAGNTTVSAENNTWVLDIDEETTVKSDVSGSDLTIDLPDGLTTTAAKGTGNTIVVTVAGTASPAVADEVDVSIVVKGSAVTEEEAADSDPITVTINPAPEPALVITVEELPDVLYQGQSLAISASASQEVAWDVRIDGEALDAAPPSGATYTKNWEPEASGLPIEKEYTLTIDTNPASDEGTFTKDITFVNYPIYVTGFSGSSASIENLGGAVSAQVVFQFFDGDKPVGCEVVPGAIAAEGKTEITCSDVPSAADKVKVSVIQFGTGEDPWDEWVTLSSFYEFNL